LSFWKVNKAKKAFERLKAAIHIEATSRRWSFQMTFSIALRQWLGFAFAPSALYRQMKKRIELRQDLQRLTEDPYLLDDVGFSRDAARRELDRAPWLPVTNLRMPPRLNAR
jgi:hypothetical protein